MSSTASFTPLSKARASAAVWNVRPATAFPTAAQSFLFNKLLFQCWRKEKLQSIFILICLTVFQVASLPMVESRHHSVILEVFLDRATHHHLDLKVLTLICWQNSPSDRWSSFHRWGTHACTEGHPRGEPELFLIFTFSWILNVEITLKASSPSVCEPQHVRGLPHPVEPTHQCCPLASSPVSSINQLAS